MLSTLNKFTFGGKINDVDYVELIFTFEDGTQERVVWDIELVRLTKGGGK